MAETEAPVAQVEPEKREIALVGYQVAVDLWTNEGQQEWAMFNGMLVVNSILIAVIGLAITAQEPLPWLALLLSVLGLSLCGVWLAFRQRAAQYSDYWVSSARELEERYLSGTLKTTSRGGQFADGKPVTIEINGERTVICMSKLARRFRGKKVSIWVTTILILAYIAMIVWALSLL